MNTCTLLVPSGTLIIEIPGSLKKRYQFARNAELTYRAPMRNSYQGGSERGTALDAAASHPTAQGPVDPRNAAP